MGEGINASVRGDGTGERRAGFHIAGKLEARRHWDMRMKDARHVPALLPPLSRRPGGRLRGGCFPGFIFGLPFVERIVICSIEPLIPRVVAQFFSKENYDVLQDPRTQVIYDDARHYILAQGHLDIITPTITRG